MLRTTRIAITGSLFLTIILLSACGPDANGTRYTGQPGVVNQKTRTAGATRVPSPSPDATLQPGTAGPVTLQIQKSAFHPNDTIEVVMSNQSAQTISFPDHQTGCTVILLQYQKSEMWEAMNLCKLKTPTRLQSLKAGQSMTVSLVPPPGGWLSGLYRACLSYGSNAMIHSQEFKVE